MYPANFLQILAEKIRKEECVFVGIGGPQGSGKSTLAYALAESLSLHGIDAIVLSLDDFYHTHAFRETLSKTVHPLLATRGVPGTHDMIALSATIEDLVYGPPGRTIHWPKFIKRIDDRAIETNMHTLRGEPASRTILLEGWCVGCVPYISTDHALNELESVEDISGEWRQYVNGKIISVYFPLWRKFDLYMYIEIPDWSFVSKWRGQQAIENGERFSITELEKFTKHFERISKDMLNEGGRIRTDVLVKLAPDHSVDQILYIGVGD